MIEKPVAPAVGVSINVQFASPEPSVTGGKTMVIQTHYPQGDTFEGLDKLFAEVDYHASRYEIVALEDSLRRVRFQMEDKMDQLNQFQAGEKQRHAESGRKSEYKMNMQTQSQVNKMLTMIERDKNEEIRLEKEIEKRKKIVEDHNKKKVA